MKKSATTRAARIRRHARVRRRVQGTGEKPRLSVFRSLSHIYAQVIDDVARVTIVSASDVEKDILSKADGKKKADVATLVGALVAERAKEKGVTIVSASDVEKDILSKADGKKKSDVATLVGALVAERAKEKGVTKVVFDRGGYPFHGRIKALAEAAREGGLSF